MEKEKPAAEQAADEIAAPAETEQEAPAPAADLRALTERVAALEALVAALRRDHDAHRAQTRFMV